MQRVALLGLGTMGAGMAANWLAKGFEVSVWNRTPAKAQALAGKGASVAATPREAAAGADFVFAMVADDAASRSVWLGADGALAGAKAGAVMVESSTLTPEWVRELGRHAQRQRMRLSRCAGRRQPPGGGVRRTQVLRRRRTVGPSRRRALRLRRSGAKWICSARSARARPGSSSTTSWPPTQIAALAEALDVAQKGWLPERTNLRSHPGRRSGESDRQAQAAAHARARFRASGLRAPSHARRTLVMRRRSPSRWARPPT